MSSIKSLAKDTAVYGLSSIIGRFLNWLLVPLYTITFLPGEYGVVTYIYSIVALALVVLTYGMETGFFRFANHEVYGDRPQQVYSTALISLGLTGSLFVVLVALFLSPVSRALECADHPDYIMLMAAAVAIDAFTAMPFSYMRFCRRAMRFAVVKLVGIAINIGLNLFWILLCPLVYKHHPEWVRWCWSPTMGIGYIFLANFISSAITLLLVLPELRGFRWQFDPRLWRRMLVYSWPLLVLGIAGIMNQTIDKILFPLLCSDPADAMQQLGIYGANYKIAIVMVMFIQAYRFAYEPFIFSQNRNSEGDSRLQGYRDAMLYFVIFAMVIFLAVMFYLPVLRYFISERYFSGLKVVPVIMMAEFCFGVFFNLSLWYKLTDRTIWGMWFSLIGLVVTIALNILLVPRFGYMGCAWAALTCYAVMMLSSYFVGKYKHPIGYDIRRMSLYVIAAMLLWTLSIVITTGTLWIDLAIRTVILILFLGYVVRKQNIPMPTRLLSFLPKR